MISPVMISPRTDDASMRSAGSVCCLRDADGVNSKCAVGKLQLQLQDVVGQLQTAKLAGPADSETGTWRENAD